MNTSTLTGVQARVDWPIQIKRMVVFPCIIKKLASDQSIASHIDVLLPKGLFSSVNVLQQGVKN